MLSQFYVITNTDVTNTDAHLHAFVLSVVTIQACIIYMLFWLLNSIFNSSLLEHVDFSSARSSIINKLDKLQTVTFIYLLSCCLLVYDIVHGTFFSVHSPCILFQWFPHAMFATFWQYIPSVEDTVLGIVVDTKPDVSIHLPLKYFLARVLAL